MRYFGTITDPKDMVTKEYVDGLGIPYGECNNTSTATAFTATVQGISELHDGTIMLLKNGVVTSASGFTININGLGAKPVYTNLAAATAETTKFNVNYTMLFVYDEDRVAGGCWICYNGYDSNTNTIGYQLRTNSSTLPASDAFVRYRILFTSADGTKWVPSTTSTSTNATAARAVNQRPIDPFGAIVYYSTTTAVSANANVGATVIWQQYTLTLGYSFNRTGAALVLPYPRNIYVKCAPQSDGSAIIDPDTPYVTALPTTEDGKIYIHLGRTYSATAIELTIDHPVYHYKDGAIRLWTNAASGGGTLTETDPIYSASPASGITSTDITNWNGKQNALVSGTNIKTVNGNSLLGSGNIEISGGTPTAMTDQEIDDAVDANWAIAVLHTIGLEAFIVSVTDDGSYGEQYIYERIDTAYSGTTITFVTGSEYFVSVQTLGGVSIPTTYIDTFSTGGGGFPPMPLETYLVYEFTMPDDDVEFYMM